MNIITDEYYNTMYTYLAMITTVAECTREKRFVIGNNNISQLVADSQLSWTIITIIWDLRDYFCPKAQSSIFNSLEHLHIA